MFATHSTYFVIFLNSVCMWGGEGIWFGGCIYVCLRVYMYLGWGYVCGVGVGEGSMFMCLCMCRGGRCMWGIDVGIGGLRTTVPVWRSEDHFQEFTLLLPYRSWA